MATAVKQKRQLKMHPKLLRDIISRQAGTLDKAVLEGGMNGIEAINALIQDGGKCKDKNIYITYTKENGESILTISDMGKGITTEKEIENFFETFGTPHDESEHKIYAQFRMGRGQMFNFGRNVWRTGTFRLIVDIDENGLEWELEKNLPFVEGCQIEIKLYDRFQNSFPANTVDCLKDAVKKQLEFVSTPVFYNGEQISTPPSMLKWDYEDEFAYYNFNIGDKMSIYNLGVYVKERWGMSGIVVAKQQLKVNFPRNDVMADCPVWHMMDKVIRKHLVKKSTKKYVALTKDERRSLLMNLKNGCCSYGDAKGGRILQTAQDKYISFNMFLKDVLPWTIADIGSRRADKLIEKGSHVVFATEMFDAMNYSGEKENFFEWIVRASACDINDRNEIEDWGLRWVHGDIVAKSSFYVEFDDIFDGDEEYLTIATNKTTKVEKRCLSILQDYGCWDARVLRMGISGSADAWTDGRSYINLDREFLKGLNLNIDRDVTKLFAVMVHELTHDNDTTMTDIHGDDFNQRFHDLILSYNCPMRHMLQFRDSISNFMHKEHSARVERNRREELELRAKKLGLG